MNRYCNHFYDPINDRSLQLSVSFGLILCNNNASNIAWALGNSNANADGSGAADVNRINGFSLRDAREAMWRALTGTNGQGTNVAPDRKTRDAYWATTFRSLGDVVHLVQDLSQPQHTRNEPHAVGQPAAFEDRINGRALGLFESLNGRDPTRMPVLVYDGHTPPSFARYRDFFSTGSGAASYSGKWVANYSNRGCFTTLANLGNTKYAQPSSVLSNYTQELIGTTPYLETYLKASVFDNLTGQPSEPILMTRESILKALVQDMSAQYSYSIDTPSIDAQANPRVSGDGVDWGGCGLYKDDA